jgi:putative PEP-CTERM system integral membrane protein
LSGFVARSHCDRATIKRGKYMPKKLTFRARVEKTFNSIFWGWNIIFLLMDTFLFYFLSIPLILATFLGEIPLDFSLTILALMIMPILSIILAKKHFDKQPRQLMRFFYGVEAPLFVLCLIRLFLIRELTPVSGMFLGTICLCIAAFFGELLYGYVGLREDLTEPTIKNNNFWARLIGQEKMAWLQMGCHSLMLIIGLYAATILFFYALPVAVSTVNLALQFVGGIFYAISHANYSWENISYMLLSSLYVFGVVVIYFLRGIICRDAFLIRISLSGIRAKNITRFCLSAW